MALKPGEVFHAFTEAFDSWFARPGSVIMTPRVNSVYFFETEFQNDRHPHYGRFLKLEPDRLVEMTWLTALGTKGTETVLRLDLEPKDGGVHVKLTHTGFPDEAACKGHEDAWKNILDGFEHRLMKGEWPKST